MSIKKINSDTKFIAYSSRKKKQEVEHIANKCTICGQVGFRLLTNVLVCQEHCVQWEEMKKDPGPLGKKIRQARELKALSPAVLACRAKVKHTNLSSWEKGQSLPRLNRLVVIAQKLGKPLAHFFEKEDQEQPLNAQEGSEGDKDIDLFFDSIFNTKAFNLARITCKVCGKNRCVDINLFAICEQDLSYWKNLSPQILGEKIKAARESRSLIQSIQAAKIPVPLTTWSQWENGKRIIQLADLEKIAAALEVPLKHFFENQ